MWQIFSLLSVLSNAIEETVDKAAIVGNKAVDTIGATWVRNAISVVIAFLGGWLIERHFPHLFLSLPIIILGVLYAIQAILYTTILRHIEITASSLITNFIPIVFLPIDILIVGAPFLPRQIVGVFLLVAGGVIFFLKHERFTKQHLQLLTGVFVFDVIIYGLESYSFKSLFVTNALSATDFLWSMWSVMLFVLSMVFIGMIIYQKALPSLAHYSSYIQRSLVSKTADYTGSFFFLQALTLASASQVAAMKAIYPLTLVVLVIIAQKRFDIDLGELLDRNTLFQKIIASIVLCVGVYLIR